MSAAMPWVFVLGLAAGTMLPVKRWLPFLPGADQTEAARDSEAIVRRAGNAEARYPIEMRYAIDGDTFGARVHLGSGEDVSVRIRLRGIDAPELKGQCAREIQKAETATAALTKLLREGSLTIYNIGPDKYPGRVVADVATRQTPNVSAALLGAGHARAYGGGHRNGWCDNR
ncbi:MULTISPECIES: thermonuclease family protein [unclassified Tardiphaga]|jgi:endonuclease YncB( thermonuclease family)|uniref:thermonuclease family protein n=1 Tax=unclassified Tardiphaga TaxID=2631404 RepID=UPI0008A78E49|nr:MULTISPECIES: thermonuclease family protein [unclassified Tardiphaga]UFS75291.1 thermonuclease family protein [Tardiphaga sp. 37S4]WPO42254.1 thermonuclease family protein [Tardiphaga sp. 42S5]SEH78880.1 Endonuclease YncB, thermonuclease family [Tardiphaga sp. OK245]